MSTAPVQRLTAQEYLAIERASVEQKHEFYAGEMFAMGGASREHNSATIDLATWLNTHLRQSGCDVFSTDMRVLIDRTGLYTYPDIVALCEEPEFLDGEFDTLLNPRLIVEVLSESTASYDRGKKFDHYRQIPSLREYLLVSQEEARIDRFSLLDDGRWALEVSEGLDNKLGLEIVDEPLPLAEVYRRVKFDNATNS